MITLTERASLKIRAQSSGTPRLRVSVRAGGCSGFSYVFETQTETDPDDEVYHQWGVSVLVDPATLSLIDGATIDFVEGLMTASFTVSNPNATASCGCGTSFTVPL